MRHRRGRARVPNPDTHLAGLEAVWATRQLLTPAAVPAFDANVQAAADRAARGGWGALTPSTPRPARPLVFLDVDGTLLPFPAMGADPTAPRVDPRHGRRLARLPGDLVWATTWMDQANDLLTPVLGLPRLPVLDPSEPTPEDRWFGLHWKTRAITDLAAGRPFAWVDDEISDADREWVADRHPAPALLLRVDPHVGVTTEDLGTLEAWLRDTAARCGRSPDL